MRRVIIVGIAPAQELDVIAPLNVFSIANDVLEARGDGARLYEPEVVSGGSSRTIRGQSGVGLAVERRFDEVRGTIDTLLIAGGTGAMERIPPRLLEWIKRRAHDMYVALGPSAPAPSFSLRPACCRAAAWQRIGHSQTILQNATRKLRLTPPRSGSKNRERFHVRHTQ